VKQRLASLDLFRGLTVAGMIFVNNPGDWGHLYWPFDHAEWHGWTPTDLIFPFFLFIVGTAGALSLAKRRESATTPVLLRQAFVRGMTIAVVGWAMAWFPFTLERLSRLRIPGVLPRIGLVFVLGTALVLLVSRRAIPWVVGALLAVHTFLLTGLGFDLTRSGNVQRAVDLAVLNGHLWKKDWDPEGLVSTLTAVATMLTGTLAGWLLLSDEALPRKVGRLLAWGAVGIAVGQASSFLLPINKNLWTASYVVLTSGFAALSLGVCLHVVDVKGVMRPFAFFLTFGRNPLLAFVLSGLLAKSLGLVKWTGPDGKLVSLHRFLYRGALGWIGDPTLASHAWAVLTVLFWYGVMRLFERKGWYWKV